MNSKRRWCIKHVYEVFVFMWVLLHTNTSTASKCIDREREALLAIKTDMVDDYNRLSSWGSGEDCCKWKGVYCDIHTGHVLQLDLANPWISNYKPLQGKLSSKLVELRNLTYLDLSYNKIQGDQDTTSFIGSLTNLRYLDLSKNHFCGGQILHQLGNLTHLEYLNLALYCTDDAPIQNLDSLLHHHSLRYLDLSYHNLSRVSDWLEIVNKLPNLKNLTLNGCDLPPPNLSHTKNASNSLDSVSLFENPAISSSIFKWLFNYNTTLVYLRLTYTQLTLIPDAAFRYMTSLAYLELSHNKLSGPIPADVFKNLRSLSHLSVSYNNLSGPIPPNVVRNLSSLVHLSLYNNDLSGSIPDAFGNMSLLRLDLSNNLLDGLIPQSIGQITGPHPFERLNLSNNSLVGPMPNVTNLLSLKALYLQGNRLSGPLSKSIGHLSSLEELNLGGNQLLSGKIPQSIGNLSSLIRLDLSENRLSGRLPESIGNLSSLEILDLSDNRLSGRLPQNLGQIHRLVDLDLSNNNLSGEIPTGTHLQRFPESTFIGNPHLCGLPLQKMCAPEKKSQDGDEDDSDKFVTRGFYIALALGFLIGFWGVCGSLIFNKKWRYAYYRFLEDDLKES